MKPRNDVPTWADVVARGGCWQHTGHLLFAWYLLPTRTGPGRTTSFRAYLPWRTRR